MQAHLQEFSKSASFNYFDLFVAVWLIVGLLRGRKLGMSQELLPMVKWICIAVASGIFYRQFAPLIRQNTSGSFDPLWINIIAYVLIALVILLLFGWIKKLVGDKLVGSDIFGRYEYYLGMLGGIIRFACMLIVVLAIMNSRVYTKTEIDAYEAAQKKALDNSFFPSYGEVQYAIFSQSFTGPLVRTNLQPILIASVTADQRPQKPETIGQKKNDAINDVLGPAKK